MGESTTLQTLSVVAAWGSAVATLITCGFMVIIYKGQKQITQEIAKSSASINRGTNLINIWGYISTLNEVNPENPITPVIIKNVNTLELVGLLYEAEVVDRGAIIRTFQDTFLNRYAEIEQCGRIPGLNKTGKQILFENKAAMSLYEMFKEKHMKE